MTGVSVVIPTRDRPALLAAALEALIRAVRPDDEVVVVDSASRDPAVRRVAAAHGVKIVRLEQAGTSRARNAGVASTTGALVAFLDDDCLVSPSWIEQIERAFEDPDSGFVTGRVVADREAKSPVSIVKGSERRVFDPEGDFSRMGGGVNMSLRRDALQVIGGFDEGMGPATQLRAAEDHDVIWRLLRAGWAGIYEPSIVVTHQQWRTTRQAIQREYAYGVGAGALAVKMIRSGDPRGWATLRARFWGDGLAMSGRNLVRGYESGAAGAALKAAGVMVGAVRASRIQLVDGRFGA
ncbi:MAG: glycosyltransferase [Actinomycetota bacterium]